MKEHGIIFKGPLVRAIMEGRKTQTRRVPSSANTLVDGSFMMPAKWKACEWDWDSACVDPGPSVGGYPFAFLKVPSPPSDTGHRLYPRWQPGDVLWVREGFYVQPTIWNENKDRIRNNTSTGGYRGPQPIHYAADMNREEVGDYVPKPSIHMPRWASRLTLRVKRVWPERVQEISYTDELAEGVPLHTPDDRAPFRHLWDSINEKRGWGWELDRPVWCIEFERV